MNIKNGKNYEASRYWLAEEESLLRTVIDGSCSLEEIKIKYFPNKTVNSIKLKANRLGIKNEYIHRKYETNQNFWAETNLENSYWAGIFAADCYITKETIRQRIFQWAVAYKDRVLLEKFIKSSASTFPIFDKKDCKNPKSCIRIGCDQWALDLSRHYNFSENKKFRLPPLGLNNILKYSYLRGYTDGDGSISIQRSKTTKNRKTKKPLLVINYTSSSIEIINWIKEITDSNFYGFAKTKRKVIILGGGTHATFSITGQKAVQMFLFMSKLNVPCLDRKWKNPEVLALVEKEISERPEAYKDFL
jgi:hypothetical protein